MNYIHTRRIVALFIGMSMLTVPAMALAQTSTSTVSDLQTQIQALLTQLTNLRLQLIQLTHASTTPKESGDDNDHGTATSTAPTMPGMGCPSILRNLSLGSQGNDVSALQKFLAQDSTIFPEGSITGFFGQKTMQAMMRFQQKFNVASTTTGIVGPLTRDFFSKRCPMPGDNNQEHGDNHMGTTTMPWGPNMGTTTPPWHPGMGTTTQWMNDDHHMPPPMNGTSSLQHMGDLRFGPGWLGSLIPHGDQ